MKQNVQIDIHYKIAKIRVSMIERITAACNYEVELEGEAMLTCIDDIHFGLNRYLNRIIGEWWM
jgi:hypothetical protein